VQALAPDSRDLRKGAKIIVYKAKIEANDPHLRYPRDVVAHVPDAVENQEHWYLAPLEMDGRSFVVKDYATYYDVAWSVVSVQCVRDIINFYVRDDRAKEQYLKVIAGTESSLDAYEAVRREANRQGNPWFGDTLFAELMDIDGLWSSILRVEYFDLIPIAQAETSTLGMDVEKISWKRNGEELVLAEWYGLMGKLESLSKDLLDIDYVSDIGFYLQELLDGVSRVEILITMTGLTKDVDGRNASATMKSAVILALEKHGLKYSFDPMEDFGGKAWDFVCDCSVWVS
jgi:hypothetical protein